ncbi:MAG: NTPase [Methanobacterium sp.]|jgi:nucleoside-triphosphatase|nr:NTPase [Methanobacterium sp.]
MNILITGPPGAGKTTILEEIKNRIRDRGYSVGGISCPEIREKGIRTGFYITDLSSGLTGVLASIYNNNGPKIGKYGVNVDDIREIGIKALKNALKTADYIFIDEIGPMELKSTSFSQTVWEVMESQKPVIAVIHQRSRNSFILKVKNRKDALIFNLTMQNRDSLTEEILDSIK